MKDNKLEITIKVTEGKGIILCRSVLLFNRPFFVAGLLDNSIVFTCLNPETLKDAEVCVYTIKEVKELFQKGKLYGLVDIERINKVNEL